MHSTLPALAAERSLARSRPALFVYLANLNAAQRVLWCYLIWYLEVLFRYFDPDPRLWINSLGLSAISGTGLYLSTVYGRRERTALARWQIARMYVMPLCVSSFAALIKDRGFLLIFHPSWHANLHAAAACLAFVGLCHWLRHRGGSKDGYGGRACASQRSVAPS